MKAQDLRIGNLITHKGVEQIITGIDVDKKTQILHTNKNAWLDISEVEPIALTNKLLVKYGFNYDRILIDMILKIPENKIIGYDLKNKRLHVYHMNHEVNGANLCKIEYVHEFQNIYYDITKHELAVRTIRHQRLKNIAQNN